MENAIEEGRVTFQAGFYSSYSEEITDLKQFCTGVPDGVAECTTGRWEKIGSSSYLPEDTTSITHIKWTSGQLDVHYTTDFGSVDKIISEVIPGSGLSTQYSWEQVTLVDKVTKIL